MRIISGTHGGRIIQPPKNFLARPTTDQAREGLFNVLMHRSELEGIRVLDLFSGTGGISFEFASRGAEMVIAVELEFLHAEFIRKTAAGFQMQAIRVIRSEAMRYLEKEKNQYHIIFADPPFNAELWEEVHGVVSSRNLLFPQGMLILEHPSGLNLQHLSGFNEMRKYGGVAFSFFSL